jgi:hypothetical protein
MVRKVSVAVRVSSSAREGPLAQAPSATIMVIVAAIETKALRRVVVMVTPCFGNGAHGASSHSAQKATKPNHRYLVSNQLDHPIAASK